MVQTQLGLSRDEFLSLQGIMESFREHRMALSQAQAALRHRLRDPGLESLGDSEALDLLEEMIHVQEEELDLYRREREELLGVLSPTQLVLFYRLRDQLSRQVDQLRRGRGPGGMGLGQGGLGIGRSYGPF
jgi:hypothetical protein